LAILSDSVREVIPPAFHIIDLFQILQAADAASSPFVQISPCSQIIYCCSCSISFDLDFLYPMTISETLIDDK